MSKIASVFPDRFVWILFGLIDALLEFVRPRAALVAENLFLRKQLAFYREREVKPHRLTDSARLSLWLWSRWFDGEMLWLRSCPSNQLRTRASLPR